tara:strand:- start:340 stop:573 length:234 start_codon:yes stop_codon:yes gene_type:complete
MIEIIFLILLSAGNIYFIWRALTLANVTADQEEYIQELEDMSQYMYDQISNTYNEMKKLIIKEHLQKMMKQEQHLTC